MQPSGIHQAVQPPFSEDIYRFQQQETRRNVMIGLSGIRLRIIVLTIAFTCLAACGAGEDDGSGSTDNASSGTGSLGAALACTTVVLVSGNSQCVNDAMSPGSSS